MEPSTIAAFTNPEILIGTFGYLLLKPALKNSGLVDTKKGAYKSWNRSTLRHGRKIGRRGRFLSTLPTNPGNRVK